MTDTTGLDALLPCPFCGNAATYAYSKTKGWKAECEGRWGTCTINARTHYQPTKAQATDAWNRRTAHSSGVKVKDEELTGRLKELATEVFPSANKYAVSDGVKRIISILERVTPDEYATLHASMFPPITERFGDGQPDEIQEWHDYDPDC